jgi:hypothetical protein
MHFLSQAASDESVYLMAENIWNEGMKLVCGPLYGNMFHGEQCSS